MAFDPRSVNLIFGTPLPPPVDFVEDFHIYLFKYLFSIISGLDKVKIQLLCRALRPENARVPGSAVTCPNITMRYI